MDLSFFYHNYYAFLILCTIVLFIGFPISRILWRHGLRMYAVLNFIGLFWGYVKFAQLCHVGPVWFRSWGADVAFVPAFTAFGATRFLSKRKDYIRFYAWGSALFAIFFEIYTIYINNRLMVTQLSSIKGLTGRGDPIDMYVFYVMLILCLWVIQKQQPNVNHIKALFIQQKPSKLHSKRNPKKIRRRK